MIVAITPDEYTDRAATRRTFLYEIESKLVDDCADAHASRTVIMVNNMKPFH
jgi:hypothetical protein